MALYMLTDQQAYRSQTVLNVYGYEVVDGSTPSAEALCTLFTNVVIDAMTPVQTDDFQHVGIEAFNTTDPSDFFALTYDTAIGGEVSGDGMPPFVAFSFIINRATRLTRNGWKRIGGVPEAANEDGATASAYLTLLGTLADAIAQDLVDPEGNVYRPRIVHRTVVAGVPVAYTPYPISGVGYKYISSQNTRKIGRGI